MEKLELAENIQKLTELPSQTVESGLNALEDTVANTLSEGATIEIPQLGSFATIRYPGHPATNPDNPAQPIILPPVILPKFQPSPDIESKLKTVVPETKTTETEDLPYTSSVSIPYLELTKISVPKEILAYIPEHIARRYQVVPVELKDDKLTIGMIDPEDQEAIEFIKKRTGLPVEVTLCTLEDLNHVLDQYSGLQAEVAEIVKSSEETPLEAVDEAKQETADEDEMSVHAPAAKIVGSLFKRAVRERASDIHIEPMEDEVIIRFRVDGILRKIVSLPKQLQPAIVSRIKILSNLKIDEQRLPQDGRFQIKQNNNEIDFRISTLPTVNGEKVVARILDKSNGILSLEDLGMTGHAFDVLSENITKSHGMILVTGPTGSGKTTTLYAILDRLRDVAVNIVTLEDPVEYRLPGVNQCQVKTDIGYTFANGLRSILRQDPNIIMVGEIRDFDTANISIHSALTGHIVLSTLHTNDAAGAIPRLIDMNVEPFLLTSSINAVVAQRLCRKTCPDCREELSLTEAELAPVIAELKAISPASNTKVDMDKLTFFHGKGCDACGKTGYRGRIGIFEVLSITETVKTLVAQKATSTALLQAGLKDGMVTMKQDGIIKALQGLTSLEEIWRVTKD